MSSKLFMDNVGELKEGLDGSRFQKELADFIIKNRFKTITESGYGVSSVFIIYAFKHSFDMQDAKLFSVDIDPWFKGAINSPQHELWKSKSCDALLPLFNRTGAWDLFLHDSNHDIKCMTYELEFAFSCIRVGGAIFCDDSSWGGHGAWDKFVERHGLKTLKMGDAVYAIKSSGNVLSKADAVKFNEHCLDLGAQSEAKWLAAGNKNSECFA